MGNYQAIAAVTAVLERLIGNQVAKLETVGSVKVQAAPPKDTRTASDKNDPAVHIYLYQVTPSVAWRNADLPTHDTAGRRVRQPTAALDLHYLISFYGDEQKWIPQLLLGRVVSLLHSQPVLTPATIEEALRDNVRTDDDFLLRSRLADQVERVKLTPATLSLEEMSKLWTVFFQVPYALSLTYQASVVFITDEEPTRPPVAVREPRVHVTPFRQPVIETLAPAAPTIHQRLTIAGQQLAGDAVLVDFGRATQAVRPVSGGRLEVDLPPELQAGVNSVQVIHQIDLGTAGRADWRRSFASNIVPFVLRPVISVADDDGGVTTVSLPAGLTVHFEPGVGASQQVLLLLAEDLAAADDHEPRAYVIPRPEPAGPEADDRTSSITFDLSGVAAGDYFVRVQVDGAGSELTRDERGAFAGPKVTVEA